MTTTYCTLDEAWGPAATRDGGDEESFAPSGTAPTTLSSSSHASPARSPSSRRRRHRHRRHDAERHARTRARPLPPQPASYTRQRLPRGSGRGHSRGTTHRTARLAPVPSEEDAYETFDTPAETETAAYHASPDSHDYAWAESPTSPDAAHNYDSDGSGAEAHSDAADADVYPVTQKYHAAFARPSDPSRVPNALHVELGTNRSPEADATYADTAQAQALVPHLSALEGARPFAEAPEEEADAEAELSHAPAYAQFEPPPPTSMAIATLPSNPRHLSPPRTRTRAGTHAPTHSPAYNPSDSLAVTTTRPTPRAKVRNELEWMRNNLSHLGDRIETLTRTVRAAAVAGGTAADVGCATATNWSEPLYDTALYLITGIFILFLLDVMYRAGQRGGVE